MTDYEIGRKARRDGEPLEACPYWGWFRRAAWQRGWTEQNRAHATWATAKQPSSAHHSINEETGLSLGAGLAGGHIKRRGSSHLLRTYKIAPPST